MASILIVDDHPAMRLVLKAHLAQRLGIGTIFEADSGREALAIVREHAPDVVMLDLDIPHISGLDVAPRLLALRPVTRILVVSGQDPAVFAARASRAGAMGFVSKTQPLEEIVRCVESVLAGYSVFPVFGRPGAEMAVDDQARLRSLSDREVAVLRMLAAGLTNRDIADALFLSNKTVSSYKARLMAKLRAESLVDLVDFARRCRLAA